MALSNEKKPNMCSCSQWFVMNSLLRKQSEITLEYSSSLILSLQEQVSVSMWTTLCMTYGFLIQFCSSRSSKPLNNSFQKSMYGLTFARLQTGVPLRLILISAASKKPQPYVSMNNLPWVLEWSIYGLFQLFSLILGNISFVMNFSMNSQHLSFLSIATGCNILQMCL